MGGAVLVTVAAYVALGGSSGEEPLARSALGTGTWTGASRDGRTCCQVCRTIRWDWVIGEPFGTGFAREVQGSEVLADPHSFYVTTLLRAGVVGFVALIARSFGLLLALRQTPAQTGGGLLTPGVFPALLAMQAVWFLTWEPGMEQGIITGLAVGLVVARGRGAAPAPHRGRGVHPLPQGRRGNTSARRTRPGDREASGPANRKAPTRVALNDPNATQAGSGLLWVTRDDSAPHPYLVTSARQAGAEVREIHWAEPLDGERSFGRFVELRGRRHREHPMSVKAVSPRLLAEFVRAPEDVVVIYELGLVGLDAGLSKLLRRHKVVSLVEGDYRHIGRTGSARLKVALRRFAARFVDVFVANNLPRGTTWSGRSTNVDKIVVGWWLAGFPAALVARPPRAPGARDGAPLFVSAGRLIPQKGVHLLI